MAINLPTGKTAVAYSGSTVDYTITAAGIVHIKLWGAGGGSANYTGTNFLQNYGGSGAFIDFIVKVAVGDILTVQVAQGGQSPVLSPASGGVGGYPDGGSGGSNGAVLYTQGAGGGGSTRVYLNSVLIAVAGGGGGGGGSSGTQQNNNNIIGAPGGLIAPAVSSGVLGGSQSAGGTNTFGGVSGQNGASLQGGNGFNTGFSTAQTNTASNAAGGGGGGGYFGGAGGGNYAFNSAAQPGACNGAGGSSWHIVNSVVTKLRNIGGLGNHGTAPNYMDVDFVAGVGACGNPVSGTASRATAGGNGRAVLNYLTPTTLNQGKQTLTAIGNFVVYAITQTGIVRTKMWGAGGGGAITAGTGTSANARGSGGGFTTMDIAVVPGDVLAFQVGGGGQPSSVVSTHLGGAGGYPDGGWGGYDTQSFYNGGGGGGGSSRVYLNNVLLGVAGGGAGGAGNGSGSNQGAPGAGGGTNGGQNTAFAGIGGGTQSAGGVNTGDNTQNGQFLLGGNGFPYDFTNNGNYGGVGGYYGGGGGGGYYGGAAGGHVATNNGAAGGGGSGFVASSSVLTNGATSTPTAGSVTPANTADVDYPAGIGVGGNGNANTTGTGVAGTGGAVVFDFILTLPVGTTNVAYTGQALSWQAASSGTATFKMWGAGGGTHGVYNGGNFGGGGGMTTVTISIVAGDIVQVWTGSGGLAPINTRGGTGGWPDGGYGGFRADGSTSFGGGGGGGSSRVYINGNLAAVAGAGGGAFLNNQVNPQAAGGGGGGSAGAGGVAGGGGGTQSAGGLSPVSNAATNGALLKGGNGTIAAITSPTANLGGGGGGGYYGGGGGYTTGSYTGGGGGGGSGYVATAFTGSTTSASGRLAPTDPDKPAGIGDGGLSVSTGSPAGQPGGNGYTIMTFTQTALPVDTGGSIPTITVVMDIVGLVVSTAVINIPPTDNDILMQIGGVWLPSGAVSLTSPVPSGGVDGTGTKLTPPTAYIPGFSAGDLGTDIVTSWVTFSQPMAESGPEAHALAFASVAVAWAGPATLNASANAVNWNPHDNNGNPISGQAFVQVNLSRVNGAPSSDPPNITTLPLPNTIDLTVPGVFAENGTSVVASVADQPITLTLLTTGSSTGAANAYGAPENSGEPDSRNWRIKQVDVTNALAPQMNCGANFTEPDNTGSLTILTVRPIPTTTSGATLLISILPAKVTMRPGAAGAAENTGAMAVGDLTDFTITLSEPSYTVQTVPNAPDAILMSPVDGYIDQPPAPGFSKIKLKRSLIEKTVPPLLQHNEIALNEADGVLFSRDGSGFIRQTPYLGFGQGRVVPLGGLNGEVLSVFLDWRDPHYQTANALIEPMPANTQLYLAGDVVSVGNVALRPTTVHNYVVYKPFFLQRPLTVTALRATQATQNVNASSVGVDMSVWLGLAQWDRDFEKPGTIYSVRKFDLLGGGAQSSQFGYTLTQSLAPGWYTTIFAYEGALDGVEFVAGQCGPFLRRDMIVQGNPYGIFDGGLFPSALPSTFHNYLPATHLMDHVDLALVEATVGTT